MVSDVKLIQKQVSSLVVGIPRTALHISDIKAIFFNIKNINYRKHCNDVTVLHHVRPIVF